MAKILIVDDNQLTVDLLQTLFELEDYQVICLNNGSEVLLTVKNQRPAAILLDYYLDGTESTALIQEIRRTPLIANTPIVVFSGAEKEAEVLSAGANKFLIKPFEPSELIEIIGILIGDQDHRWPGKEV